MQNTCRCLESCVTGHVSQLSLLVRGISHLEAGRRRVDGLTTCLISPLGELS